MISKIELSMKIFLDIMQIIFVLGVPKVFSEVELNSLIILIIGAMGKSRIFRYGPSEDFF